MNKDEQAVRIRALELALQLGGLGSSAAKLVENAAVLAGFILGSHSGQRDSSDSDTSDRPALS